MVADCILGLVTKTDQLSEVTRALSEAFQQDRGVYKALETLLKRGQQVTGHSLSQLAAFLTRKSLKEKHDFVKNGLQVACESVTTSLKSRTLAVDNSKIDDFI